MTTTTTKKRPLAVALFVLLALVAAACGDDSEVGGGVKIKEGEDADAALRDKRTTTTVAAATATTPPTTAATTSTTRPATTTTAKPISEVRIQDDQQGKAFEPQLLTVRAGRTVRWTNAGNQPRSVEADNNAFRSPPIPPGGSWEWVARPGSYNYHDGTRPYAVATLNVQ